jgi:hypothetical protein
MRSWLLTVLFVFFAALVVLAGCQPPSDHGGGLCLPPDDCLPSEESADPVCEQTCIEAAPAGFTGPSLFWRGRIEQAPLCPVDVAPLHGIDIFDEPTGTMEPPCAEEPRFRWGFVARECLVSLESTCPLEGQTCAPSPPQEFSLCVYQDDDAYCPDAYPDSQVLLRPTPDGGCDTMGIQRVTLCCAAPRIPG